MNLHAPIAAKSLRTCPLLDWRQGVSQKLSAQSMIKTTLAKVLKIQGLNLGRNHHARPLLGYNHHCSPFDFASIICSKEYSICSAGPTATQVHVENIRM